MVLFIITVVAVVAVSHIQRTDCQPEKNPTLHGGRSREIIPRNPCYGTFFSQNFESEFSKNSDPPAEPKLESELWPNSDPSSGLDNFVRTSPRGSCAAF